MVSLAFSRSMSRTSVVSLDSPLCIRATFRGFPPCSEGFLWSQDKKSSHHRVHRGAEAEGVHPCGDGKYAQTVEGGGDRGAAWSMREQKRSTPLPPFHISVHSKGS